MSSNSHLKYSFGDFDLDIANRELRKEGRPLDLNGRYFDALSLLVSEQGQLVKKDQFFSEVWGEMVVSDSALTQCIKDIRKQLSDDASNPRYIQTVPGYGYRFIGDIEVTSLAEESSQKVVENKNIFTSEKDLIKGLKDVLIVGGAGTMGGVVAGMLGGLFYGLALAYAPGNTGLGATSMLFVLVALNVVIGGMGGLGVSSGMAVGMVRSDIHKAWTIAGAGFGGLVIGSVTKILALDALELLFGAAPQGITGGLEGAILGTAVASGIFAGGGLYAKSRIRPVVGAATAAGVSGVLISIVGGRLMSGSLHLLTQSFSGAHLKMDTLGRFFGEMEFGIITQTVLAGIEGFIFGACVVGAMVFLIDYLSNRKMDANKSE